MSEEAYEGREQTLVKHYVLRTYLERFACIIGHYWDTITYVDCFSGPWNVQSAALKDSSFSIATEVLRQARNTLAPSRPGLTLRCYFLESNKSAYERLNQFATSTTDISIETRNAKFEDSIEEICEYCKMGGRSSFSFIFIDPTGWTGFKMKVIASLLRTEPSEVLINFMTGHIRRFIQSTDPRRQAEFADLFGSHVPPTQFDGLQSIDLDDALAATYADSVARFGGFKYVRTAIVLHPEVNRTHFHLIYATRHPKGVEVFKEVERKAMQQMEQARAARRQRDRKLRTGQGELWSADEMHDPSYYGELRDRYTGRARRRVLEELRKCGRLEYDIAWELALREPLVWESDLKEWIGAWRKQGCVLIEGLGAKQKVPKRDGGQVLVYAERQAGKQT